MPGDKVKTAYKPPYTAILCTRIHGYTPIFMPEFSLDTKPLGNGWKIKMKTTMMLPIGSMTLGISGIGCSQVLSEFDDKDYTNGSSIFVDFNAKTILGYVWYQDSGNLVIRCN